MGGIGSGNWYRWGSQTTIEQAKRIDIRFMKKRGLLKSSHQGSLNWNTGGKPSGNIIYQCFTDHLELNFRFRRNGGEWEPVSQRITFDRTPCNYGGERLWFLCPRCDRRVAVLCGEDKLFLCRHCYQLPYASQNNGYMDNLINQLHKTGEMTFEHYEYGEGWGKKKGMHWKTFNRLNARFQRLEREWCKRIGGHL